ncbi:MAG TPA: DUF2510 domain-containing protein [Acidimicrobiales bacterium]|nr:DUF2510 domain-containing protein [Acidimicrobiales bacterium]
MSQVSPGWYPDPSGRFAQRYHDGTRWTEHVADAQGNRATDVPAGQAGPASYAGSAQPYGQGGQRSSDPYGQQAARDQESAGSGRGPGRGHGQRPGETSWDQGAGAGSQAQARGQASRPEWPHAEGEGQQGDDSWADARSRGQASGDWRAAGQGHDVARYDAGPEAARHDAGRPYGQPTGYGRPDYAYAPPASSRGFTPTIGLIMAAVGAVLLLLSLFGLDFLELSFPGLSRSISLGDIAGDFGEGAPAALGTYADFGRFLAVLVIALAILAVARVVPQLRDISALPAIVAVACGGFALWHVLAMLASGEEGVDVSPTFGAILGLLGYVGLAAGPFLRQPIQAQR